MRLYVIQYDLDPQIRYAPSIILGYVIEGNQEKTLIARTTLTQGEKELIGNTFLDKENFPYLFKFWLSELQQKKLDDLQQEHCKNLNIKTIWNGSHLRANPENWLPAPKERITI